MGRRRSNKPMQLALELRTWGGRREGAGRKRSAARPSVAHVVRPVAPRRAPLLITMRMRDDITSLRAAPLWPAVADAFRAFRGHPGLGFVHVSVMRNHLHIIAESDGRAALSHGMQTFATRLGKAINRVLERRGSVFAGRYHARALATPTEVRNALRYVLLNARHHAHELGRVLPAQWIDPCSTAASFDGWVAAVPLHEPIDLGTSPARSWLLRVGWRRLGLLDITEIPGAPQRAIVRDAPRRAA